ncbi:alpha/beta hydrolase family protein [Actinoallomurus rhizosphaericola]|uniref:alpha/beta hydrolase family protein n=1 Tax=Actinoallomurus rhizosphaericola TaxID=2952536 RepID=UPI002094016F|nr:lipase [Actinoallomurus rhizosphaericola]MCO5998788.1 lipase [Actinoallomurus rhizosphaericola]
MQKIISVVAAIVALVFGALPVPAASARPGAARPATTPVSPLSLPRPTGPYRIGTVSLHLVDPSRRDPWVESHPARELMAQLWYPATRTAGLPRAPYMPPLAGRHLDAFTAQALGAQVPEGTFHGLRTHSYEGAPVARPPRTGWPVVVFSPGDGMIRSSLTGLAEDLASHGFAVAGIDHTHDADEVEFPGGRLEVGGVIPPGRADEETLVRAADVRFVLDRLAVLDAGADPDAEGRWLPAFRGTLDLTRVGMFGHSHGAEATAETMLQDRRVIAGLGLDGGVSDRVAAAGLPAPYMVISGATAASPLTERNLTALWPHMTAWHRRLRLRDSGHLTFTDFETFAGALRVPQPVRAQLFGALAPERAVAVERAYVESFFAEHLDHRRRPILDRPSPHYPEMTFEAS